ncbi:MAG TPA: 4'-phosphopantetheinyl transferase superfamily protein [Kofleriaceae bacterium]
MSIRSERLATPFGEVVLVEGATLEDVHPDEQALARTLTEKRRRELVGGRAALRAAIGDYAEPIGSDDRGAPSLSLGWSGSISHKGDVAAAIAAPLAHGHVGVDLERAAPSRVDISRRILTPRELALLPADPRAVTLRFSIKEAIYKAIDPVVRRYVGFQEVELDFEGDTCTVTTRIPLAIEAAWREHAGFWVSVARAR